ncbi:MAG: DedA family protein [Alphaproteobacteria bacterium]|nr:DedA family protein [Alphaproteobacteria bacterium]
MRSTWRSGLLTGLLILCLAAAGLYGTRSYRTFVLLRAAQSLNVPQTSSIRAWMTLDYLSAAYGVGRARLIEGLGLAAATDGALSIRTIAERRNEQAFDVVAEAQTVIAGLVDHGPSQSSPDSEDSVLDQVSASMLSGVLVYGYPVLLAIVFFGSLGLPVPAGPVTAFAGSLAASGQMAVALTFLIAATGSLLGDLAAYAIGRAARPSWLLRWGRYIGYTDKTRARTQDLFQRWGGATVFLGMSLLSQVSSVVGVIAGISRWSLLRFAAAAGAGRLVWTLGYFGLGLLVGTNFAAASGFLGNVGALVLSLAGATAKAFLLYGKTGART